MKQPRIAPQKKPPQQIKPAPDVGHNVRNWRKFRGMTLEALAEEANVTHGAISQLERGETNYTQQMLTALSGPLECTPGELVDINPFEVDEITLIPNRLRRLSPDERRVIAKMVVDYGKTPPKGSS